MKTIKEKALDLADDLKVAAKRTTSRSRKRLLKLTIANLKSVSATR